jgi:hypothetical protein
MDPNAASNAWTQLSQAWAKITKDNKVARFFTEGITNQASSWWSSVKQFWSTAINGKTAKKFNIEGIVNQASTWWSSVKQYWSQRISGQTASRFTIAGIVNQASSWWSNVKQYWSTVISGQSASKFTIAGIVNQAGSWWNSVKGYWSDATANSSLKASVSIGDSYNAFVSAWNALQTYFNNNPITAIVKTVTQAVTTTTNASKSYQSSGTTGTKSSVKVSSNGALNLGDDAINAFKKKKKKATGGVYKNGQWHDIRNYAAGGSPLSGQMFIAREAGPELVGNLGGSTAVMNNDQIVASVSAGVAQAVASVLGGGTSNEIVFKVDSETLYRMVRKGERKASGRYSTVVAIG